MGEKIVVGPVNKGLRTDRLPFNIDNDSFPTLVNAYEWRGRIKRKRGTSLLNRLERFFNSTVSSYAANGISAPFVTFKITLVAGAGNLLTGTWSDGVPAHDFTLQSTGNIVPGSVTITNVTVAQTYTDPSMDGTLTGSLGGTGTINYATGAFTITGGAGNNITAQFLYYPGLPVMGLKDLVLLANQFPGNVAFDTDYSYNIVNSSPYSIYDVSFYKNPPVAATLPGYVQKVSVTPTSWNGQDYQQFWTVNYEGALWATNGINVPFSATNVGMQYKAVTGVAIVAAGAPAIVNLTIVAHGLVVGDFLFLNEIGGNTGLNMQTGYVTVVVNANTVTVELPLATVAGAFTTAGIAQYLTNRSDPTKDCLRWYDGDPTDGNATNPTLNGNLGWVNFAPPLISVFPNAVFTIADTPADVYYLVGARMILPYKDRLLFIGPVIQTSAANSQVYLQDTVIYSQNGTPYYTASFAYAAVNYTFSAATTFRPILVPTNQTAQPTAYWEDQTGFGGFIEAGFAQPIITASPNEDVLILGFTNKQTRLVYSGNDVVPFNFFVINSELGSGSTFSSVTLDRGVLTTGEHGIIQTSQVGAQRVDLEIPDQIFQFNLLTNGVQRVTSQRDFIKEWIYFTYPDNETAWKFPNQTLQYNYREQSWAIFNEAYTTYGTFRRVTGETWATIGAKFPSWDVWNEPWNAGNSDLLQPQVIAGNQQGFVMIRDDGTDEGFSLYIQSFSGQTVTSPDHCLNDQDFIIINGCIGTIGATVNGKIFQVSNADQNTFEIEGDAAIAGTYVGGGTIQRIYRPRIQTKQFPVSWGMGRKTRIGAQQYLLTRTSRGQITLQIFLSQDESRPYNFGAVVPSDESQNNALVYSDVLYTCPESTNLGLTPANSSLQMITDVSDGSSAQSQIWHRMNTSLIGDTVQIGFTLSDDQMRSLLPTTPTYTITGATQAYPCVLTCTNLLGANQLIKITGVNGMTQLNNKVYIIISRSPTTITINVDSTAFGGYTSGGTIIPMIMPNQFAEIEMHGFVLDVAPSSLLA